MIQKSFIFILLAGLFFSCNKKTPQISGELKTWHKITVSVDGPKTSEYAKVNPFMDYRMEVTFTNGDTKYQIPGFYSADGNAAETSAEDGNKWIVRFRPDKAGEWTYQVHFKKGKNISLSDKADWGEPVSIDGFTGSFVVNESDKQAPDFRAKGRIEYTNEHYLKFADGSYFLKGGADSPENFLAYADFDQTYRYGENTIEREGEANPKESIHQFEAHLKDWNEGDPVWQGGKGKTIIGVVNYLASKGMNSIYMLTLNIIGDGKDVWPYSDHNERYRFDCSKLDQWEIVFDHMEKKGIMIHLVLQETENECLLDGGNTDVQRKLYLRELVARFGHHLGVTWNLGEENGIAHWTPVGQDDRMRKDMATYLRKVNPYPSFIVLHTHADNSHQDEFLNPMLGFENLDGPSMQISKVDDIHSRIKHFVKLSKESGRPWVVNLDEIGMHYRGVMPDSFDARHDTVRHKALWGAMMAGSGGVEWYFGYRYPHNDLNCEDLRSRDIWWDQTRIALDFFEKYIPFSEMFSADELVNNNCYCFAKTESVYATYKPINMKSVSIDLGKSGKTYQVQWYNPRNGGELQKGTVSSVESGKKVNIGLPPSEEELDWVALIK